MEPSKPEPGPRRLEAARHIASPCAVFCIGCTMWGEYHLWRSACRGQDPTVIRNGRKGCSIGDAHYSGLVYFAHPGVSAYTPGGTVIINLVVLVHSLTLWIVGNGVTISSAFMMSPISPKRPYFARRDNGASFEKRTCWPRNS